MSKNKIYQLFNQVKKQIAVLIDPDKTQGTALAKLIDKTANHIDFYFVGGSLLSANIIDETITQIKQLTTQPIIIFPGSGMQISKHADAILLLSLISGRNAELLIGQHVQFAAILQNSNLEIIPTGYILVDGGTQTTVSYISNTNPIPQHKPEIATLTALAGTQLGLQCIYLEAGSGAKNSVHAEVISSVKKQIKVPLIVGGGIKSKEAIQSKFDAGADIVVIGNALEENENLFL